MPSGTSEVCRCALFLSRSIYLHPLYLFVPFSLLTLSPFSQGVCACVSKPTLQLALTASLLLSCPPWRGRLYLGFQCVCMSTMSLRSRYVFVCVCAFSILFSLNYYLVYTHLISYSFFPCSITLTFLFKMILGRDLVPVQVLSALPVHAKAYQAYRSCIPNVVAVLERKEKTTNPPFATNV